MIERIGYVLCVMSGIVAVSNLFMGSKIAQVQTLGAALILFVLSTLFLTVDAAINGD